MRTIGITTEGSQEILADQARISGQTFGGAGARVSVEVIVRETGRQRLFTFDGETLREAHDKMRTTLRINAGEGDLPF